MTRRAAAVDRTTLPRATAAEPPAQTDMQLPRGSSTHIPSSLQLVRDGRRRREGRCSRSQYAGGDTVSMTPELRWIIVVPAGFSIIPVLGMEPRYE